MKIFAFVISLGFCLLFLPFVNSVKCIMCDPNYEGLDCKETYIDCGKDHELGDAFDSCFTYEMVIEYPDGSNFTHLDKNCSISEGCTSLKNKMCNIYNTSLQGAVRRCNIHCCNSYDYCNIGKPDFSKPETETSTHSSYSPTRTTGHHHVLGYRSRASKHRVNSVKCIMCDPNYEGLDCKETYIDCGKDHELGDAFDSCFTYEMVIEYPDGSNFTHLDKNCSISEGCTSLKNKMCNIYNTSLQGAVRRCNIHCCNSYDYCNIGKPDFSKPETETSTHSSYSPTRTTGHHHVLGYRSRASKHRGERWILFWGILLLVIYSMTDGALL